ncbi:spore germination protein [Aquibacillus sp. 3ASR75-11]|uniref:Spore germination protein n=1 Tax=Terrihalobacillus insolitus TaxID=2950438 RepID=A0A9X3WWK8_9BACI|nr:endospore germination permease [Terrihalobacillus insolitus]MDC3413589.1 spore germination protein [Terrihalobacillus insolitus]MDC3424654.1 spore germination protein [Terrihalobacillus insolitus]
MKDFEYGDEQIGEKELRFAIPSIVIGVGVLSLPRVIAQETNGVDGWVSILLGGGLAMFMTWIVATLAARFPKTTFVDYASLIVSKPIAIILTLLISIQFLLFTSYEVRSIASVSKLYLFDRTPIEFIALSFFLVVIYGVSGSRAGLFRLNLLFLPIILFIALVVSIFTLGWFEMNNLAPFFQTSFDGYRSATKFSFLSFLGFGILLFYVALVEQPKAVPKRTAVAMILPVFTYLLIYVACIGVFADSAAGNMIYPTVELAKEVEIPGEFFERFESIFFVIWIMAIFNTTALSFDVTVLAIRSVLKKMSKLAIIFTLSPIVYLVAMYPQNFKDISLLGKFITYYSVVFTVAVPILLLIIAKLRGVKGDV